LAQKLQKYLLSQIPKSEWTTDSEVKTEPRKRKPKVIAEVESPKKRRVNVKTIAAATPSGLF
jgi:hypothetical protein